MILVFESAIVDFGGLDGSEPGAVATGLSRTSTCQNQPGRYRSRFWHLLNPLPKLAREVVGRTIIKLLATNSR